MAVLGAKCAVNEFESAVITPATEVIPHYIPRREIMGQSAIRATGARLIKQRVDDLAQRIAARPATVTVLRRREYFFQPSPLSITQVTRIRLSFHTVKV